MPRGNLSICRLVQFDNMWDCIVCTFKNPAEAFKCLMCDVRKGTSTRKPRINPELVAQQVARQQQHLLQKISTQNHTKSPTKPRIDKDKDKDKDKERESKDIDEESVDSIDSSRDNSKFDLLEKSRESKDIKNKQSYSDGIDPPNQNSSSTSITKASSSSISKSARKRSTEPHSNPAGPSHPQNSHSNKKTKKDSDVNSSLIATKNGVNSKPLKNSSDRYNCASETITVNNITVLIKEFSKETKASPTHANSSPDTKVSTKNSISAPKTKKDSVQ
ncbi:uncharacterized protein LOC141853781 [Brevipalpus obovatus]|uniref:uncharacterized protein LOC141853781 n=1 Tax=Brevipalpus obovatus TaxID=246614 RepID=UPI003D9F6D02